MIPSEGQITARPFTWSSALRAHYIALPAEHGSWVFLFSPLLIGLVLGGFRPASLLLGVATLAAFLLRQPVTMAVKIYSGRRPKKELGATIFWLVIYSLVGLAALTGLIAFGYGYLAWLALPALPVFAWHLWLVSRRSERRQMLVEMVASGVLALAAPAFYWMGIGQVSVTGWWLWGLVWLQVAGTIFYAYLRLEQRALKQQPTWRETVAMAWPALSFNLVLFVLILGLALTQRIPRLLPLAYLLQPLEVIWGMLHPAIRVKPKIIGFRQLALSLLFTLLFIVTWLF